MEVIRGDETSNSYSTLNRTTIMSGSSGKKRVKKIRKKNYHKYDVEEDGGEDDVYEKIIEKTKIIVKKGKKGKKVQGSGSDEEYEYVEYDDNESLNGMREIGVYSLYMSSDLTVKHRTPKGATCMAWNGNKIKTFDGLIYNHNLRCAHTLIQDRIDGTFSVILHACPSTSHQPCAHSIEIIMANAKYSIEKLSTNIKLK